MRCASLEPRRGKPSSSDRTDLQPYSAKVSARTPFGVACAVRAALRLRRLRGAITLPTFHGGSPSQLLALDMTKPTRRLIIFQELRQEPNGLQVPQGQDGNFAS